jgi:hypothetical protein
MLIADMLIYKEIGVHWTLTLMRCLGAALVPVQILFQKFGKKIRARNG